MKKSHLLVAAALLIAALAASACAKSTKSSLASASPTPSVSPSSSPSPAPSGSATSAPMSATPTKAAATAAPATRPVKTFTLTSKDNGMHLSLVKGDTVKLELDENPSTGYSWVYDQKPSSKVLEELSSASTPAPQTSPPTAGRSQTHVWTYRAQGAGATSVKLRYQPPGQTSGGDTFSFSATVG